MSQTLRPASAYRNFAGKYHILMPLGKGYEGQVYLAKELGTGIERAIKIFYPSRNKGNKSLLFYAKKLHKLRHCNLVMQYSTKDAVMIDGQQLHFLVSEYIDGKPLDMHVKGATGKRLHQFQALHLFHTLVAGLEQIHLAGQYHGDIHLGNIIVHRYGLSYDLKLIDTARHLDTIRENKQRDILCAIDVLYEILGGKSRYGKLSPQLKSIIRGRKSVAILEHYPTMTKLREHIERLEWS